MRTLYESLLDINDIETSVEQFLMVDKWCKDNTRGLYEIDKKTLAINSSSTITITDENLVELPSYIHFGVVKRDFYCSACPSLESLEGAPKEVGKGFYCDSCTSLKSLKGAPEKVGGDFYCSNCTSLKSLEGISTHIKGKIYSNIR